MQSQRSFIHIYNCDTCISNNLTRLLRCLPCLVLLLGATLMVAEEVKVVDLLAEVAAGQHTKGAVVAAAAAQVCMMDTRGLHAEARGPLLLLLLVAVHMERLEEVSLGPYDSSLCLAALAHRSHSRNHTPSLVLILDQSVEQGLSQEEVQGGNRLEKGQGATHHPVAGVVAAAATDVAELEVQAGSSCLPLGHLQKFDVDDGQAPDCAQAQADQGQLQKHHPSPLRLPLQPEEETMPPGSRRVPYQKTRKKLLAALD